MVNLRFSHGQWRINKRLEHSVDAEDDPVTGGDIELLDGGGAEAGPHGDALAVDVVQAPGDGDLSAPRVVQRGGACHQVGHVTSQRLTSLPSGSRTA